MKYLPFILIFLFLLYGGCKDESTNPSDSPDFIPLPLKAGNYWIYSRLAGADTMRVQGQADTLGRAAFITIGEDIVWDINVFYYEQGVLMGIYYNYNGQTGIREPVVVFPKNPQPGQQWSYGGDDYQLVAKDRVVTVPAGTFTCYEVAAYYGNELVGTFWWADKVGIVKTSIERDYQLTSFRVL